MQDIKAVCITLDRNNPDRAGRAIAEIRNLGFKEVDYYPGVDGRKMPDDELKSLLTPRAYYELENGRYVHEALSSKGAVGCYLAHTNAWESCLDSGEPLAIFEDDFVATSDAKSNIPNVLKEAQEYGFDILRLQHRKNPDYGEQLYDIPGYNLIANVDRTEGGAAYIITPKAAKKLLSTHLPIGLQVDGYMDMGSHHHGLKNIASKENFFEDPALESEIGHNSIEMYQDGFNRNTYHRHTKCIFVLSMFIIVEVLLLYFYKR